MSYDHTQYKGQIEKFGISDIPSCEDAQQLMFEELNFAQIVKSSTPFIIDESTFYRVKDIGLDLLKNITVSPPPIVSKLIQRDFQDTDNQSQNKTELIPAYASQIESQGPSGTIHTGFGDVFYKTAKNTDMNSDSTDNTGVNPDDNPIAISADGVDFNTLSSHTSNPNHAGDLETVVLSITSEHPVITDDLKSLRSDLFSLGMEFFVTPQLLLFDCLKNNRSFNDSTELYQKISDYYNRLGYINHKSFLEAFRFLKRAVMQKQISFKK